jgi:hypothetical protein
MSDKITTEKIKRLPKGYDPNQLDWTYEQVLEEVGRVSWLLLDEEQRDDLMTKVVVPQWGKVTLDGVTLKGTKWAEILGTTESTIKNRYQRLCRSKDLSEGAGSGSAAVPTPRQQKDIREARSAIRKYPELAAELLKDPEVKRAVRSADTAEIRERMTRGVTPLVEPSRPEGFSWLKSRGLLGDARTAIVAVIRMAKEHGPLAPEDVEGIQEELADIRLAIEWLETVMVSGDFDDEVARLLDAG